MAGAERRRALARRLRVPEAARWVTARTGSADIPAVAHRLNIAQIKYGRPLVSHGRPLVSQQQVRIQ